MPYYTVKMRQEREWEGVIQADSEEEAKIQAHLEVQFDYISDEQIIITELHDDEDPDYWPLQADHVYYV